MANCINQACVYHVPTGKTTATAMVYCRTEREARKLVRPGTRDFIILRDWSSEQWEEHAKRQRNLGKTIKGIWWTNAKKNGWTKVVNQVKLNYKKEQSNLRYTEFTARIETLAQSAEYYGQFSL